MVMDDLYRAEEREALSINAQRAHRRTMATMTTHPTPGPWTFDGKNDAVTEHTGVVSAGHTVVCHVELDDFTDDENPWPEGYANARLIAAAPALLEALEALLYYAADHEQVCVDQDGCEQMDAIIMARAALAATKEE